MERAGRGCAEAITARWEKRRAAILCGPGNNGGDGFVIARHLKERGWSVQLSLLGSVDKLKGDAAAMAGRWKGEVYPLSPGSLGEAGLVVDALFGAGLSKPVSGVAAELLAEANARGIALVSVDVPSGLDGDSGQVLGTAPRAALTVTFCRKKVGHVLMPGQDLCGETVVVDIGIPDSVIGEIDPCTYENGQELWGAAFPTLEPSGHKYSRGHAVVVSGGASFTGAARLAARGALRVGAGLVMVASPPNALLVNAAQLTAVMVRAFDGTEGLVELLSDERKNAVAIGPGSGVGEETAALVCTVLMSKRAAVLDADALTSFEKDPPALFDLTHDMTVLTPHEGEFNRLFPDVLDKAAHRLAAAREAAATCGAIVLLKGPDTVIADAQGRAAITTNAPATLATAGSGDVLTGFITGLMAQHVPAFEAASAAAWLHGECARTFGSGLIAEDLPEILPSVLQSIEDSLNNA
jgi:NAD(P)H-hydrate epimerase